LKFRNTGSRRIRQVTKAHSVDRDFTTVHIFSSHVAADAFRAPHRRVYADTMVPSTPDAGAVRFFPYCI